MKRSVLFAVCLAGCSRTEPQPVPPAQVAASPAVRLFKEWFTAFNADDKEAFQAFAAAHTPELPPDDGSFRAMTGGFEVKRLTKLSPTKAEAMVKGLAVEQFARGEIDLDPKDSNHIVSLFFLAGPTPEEFLTPAERKDSALEGPKRTALVERIADVLERSYVDAEKAKPMAVALRAHLAGGDYDTLDGGQALAERLTDDLRAVTRDRHMRVTFGPHPPQEAPLRSEAEQLAELHRVNYGFGSIDRMQGNVARVVINGFPPAELEAAKQGIGKLMSQVADADALIIDLRSNGGGSPETVALVASYVFDDKPVHLVDIHERETNQTTQSWTQAKVPGKRFGGKKPVYVLTSKRTFSGGEEFAYDLQTTRRATIIGETTGGGAHPTRIVALNEWFTLAVPHAESISPITHGNWEGTGVVPDVSVPADAALDEALTRALDHPKRR